MNWQLELSSANISSFKNIANAVMQFIIKFVLQQIECFVCKLPLP